MTSIWQFASSELGCGSGGLPFVSLNWFRSGDFAIHQPGFDSGASQVDLNSKLRYLSDKPNQTW